MGVVEFVWVHLVRPGAELWVVEFVRIRVVCPWCALEMGAFVRVRVDHPRAPCGSLGLFGFVGFVRVDHCGRWVHFVCAMGALVCVRLRTLGVGGFD